MVKRYEILAPAGNFEALRAAVQNGADAVYLSGKNFGARKFAGNFTDEELKEAIDYCHVRDVAVYVTVNTLVLNHEFDKLREYLDFLYTAGADALIVQDMGVLQYLRKTYRDLEIHCSTQMSVQTVADIQYLESLGVARVVLGREMTLDDIKRAKKESGVQLEVFVHGALCVSVSGQCLMSSMIGGRSGNRGSCAQPCRQKYTLMSVGQKEKCRSLDGDYLLSTKDLCTLENVKEVVEAGAFSLKIEGRVKSAEYVATTVRAYRLMLESLYHGRKVDVDELAKELKIFNRGFTKGHLFKVSSKELMSMNSPGNQGYYLGEVVRYDKAANKMSLSLAAEIHRNDELQIRRKDETVGGRVEKLEHGGKAVKSCRKGEVCEVNFKHICRPGEKVYKTYDEALMQSARQTYGKEFVQVPVRIIASITRGSGISASFSDGRQTVWEHTAILPQAALIKATTAEEIKTQLGKLGGTPYMAKDIQVILDDGLAVPLKEINGLRRVLVDKLSQVRAAGYHRRPRQLTAVEQHTIATGVKEIELTYSVRNLSQLEKILNVGAQVIYYRDMETLPQAVEVAKNQGFKGQLIPEIFRLSTDAQLCKFKKLLAGSQIDTVLIQSFGHIKTFEGLRLIGDFSLNVGNDMAYTYYLSKNFGRITLSPELNLSQISTMAISPSQSEIIGYGYLPVMAMKHCVVSTVLNRQKGCGLCSEDSYSLKDKMHERFKIVSRPQCSTEIYNSKKLLLLEYGKKLASAGVGFFRLNFLDEKPEEVAEIVDLHRNFFTSGLSAQDRRRLGQIRDSGITYGHINRGMD